MGRRSTPEPDALTGRTPLALEPRLLRRAEAALYLGLSTAVLDALRARGDIRAVAVPSTRHLGETLRTPLFDKRDLDSLIDHWKGEP